MFKFLIFAAFAITIILIQLEVLKIISGNKKDKDF